MAKRGRKSTYGLAKFRPLSYDEWVPILKEIPGFDVFADAGDCTFDPRLANNAVGFIEDCCQHIKGRWAHQPFLLERWQRAIVGNIFGWVRPDGYRRFREVFIFVPRKNGKTILAVAICLCVLYTDGEEGAEIYFAARDKPQAKIAFDVAKKMVEREPVLFRHAKVLTNAITIDSMASFCQPISADAISKHGYDTHVALIDELHAHRNHDMFDVLTTSMVSRGQPLTVSLTTSDYERPGSVCNEKHDEACQIRDGVLADREFLPVIYELAVDADIADETLWKTANPNLDVSVPREYLRKKVAKAKLSPRFENTVKRLHFNIRTQTAIKFMNMELWDEVGTVFSLDDMEGESALCALDLSSNKDLTAFTMLFPGPPHKILTRVWIPRHTADERSEVDKAPYLKWEKETDAVTFTPGRTTSYSHLKADIMKIAGKIRIIGIAVDRWNAGQIMEELEEEGLDIIPWSQTYQGMSSPTKELERMVLSGELDHGNCPILRWAAGNLTVDMNPKEDIKPNKQKSPERIDPIVAAICAIGLWMDPEYSQRVHSIYETQPLMVLGGDDYDEDLDGNVPIPKHRMYKEGDEDD